MKKKQPNYRPIPVEKSFAEWRKHPSYVKAYDALADEFAVAGALIDARQGQLAPRGRRTKRLAPNSERVFNPPARAEAPFPGSAGVSPALDEREGRARERVKKLVFRRFRCAWVQLTD